MKNGIAAVITSHTTTGIFVNEALPCVESDISDMLEKSAPLNETYAHAHFLPDYGAKLGDTALHGLETVHHGLIAAFCQRTAAALRKSIWRNSTALRDDGYTWKSWESKISIDKSRKSC